MSDLTPKLPSRTLPVPTDPAEIHFKNAWQYRKDKQHEEAIREFKESLKHKPNKAATHFNLGLVYDDVGNGPQAITHAEQALKIFTGEDRANNIATAQKLVNKLRKKYAGSP